MASEHLSPRKLLIQRAIAVLLILCSSLWVAFYTAGPNLGARWGFIDDHEIALFLGRDHKITAEELVPAILSTEVGSPGYTSRYRPGYYITRIGECYLWGDSPRLWYLTRLAIWSLFLLSIALLSYNFGGLSLALIAPPWVGSLTLWVDIWPRMGTAEVYGVLGLGLVLLSSVFYLRLVLMNESVGRFRAAIGLSCLVLGSFFLLGAKENWLIFPLLFLPWIFLLFRRGGIAIKFALAIIAIYWAFLSGAVYLGVSRVGHVYRQNADLLALFDKLEEAILVSWNDIQTPVLISILGLGSLIAIFVFREERGVLSSAFWGGFNIYVLASLTIWQLLFYGQLSTSPPRYLFPYSLIPLFLWINIIWILSNALSALRAPRWALASSQVVLSIYLASVNVNLAALRQLRLFSESNVEITRTATHRMRRILDQSANLGAKSILIDTYAGPREWEFAISTARFMRFFGAPPVYLRAHKPVAKITDPLHKALFKEARKISKDGARNFSGEIFINPLKLKRIFKSPCVSLAIDVRVASPCPVLDQYP